MCVHTGSEHNYFNEKDREDRTSSVQKCLGRAQCPSLTLPLILSCTRTHSHGHSENDVPLDSQVNSAETQDDKLTPLPSIKTDMNTRNKTFKPRLFTIRYNNTSNYYDMYNIVLIFQKCKISNQYCTVQIRSIAYTFINVQSHSIFCILKTFSPWSALHVKCPIQNI